MLLNQDWYLGMSSSCTRSKSTSSGHCLTVEKLSASLSALRSKRSVIKRANKTSQTLRNADKYNNLNHVFITNTTESFGKHPGSRNTKQRKPLYSVWKHKPANYTPSTIVGRPQRTFVCRKGKVQCRPCRYTHHSRVHFILSLFQRPP